MKGEVWPTWPEPILPGGTVGHDGLDVSVIVPTRNEAGNVAELVQRVADATHGWRTEIVFVDDSDDETPEEVGRVAGDAACRVRLIHRPAGRRAGGLGGAVAEGLVSVTAPWAVVMDGDLQHPPELIPELLETAVRRRADVVVASRYAGDGDSGGLDGASRRLVSRTVTTVTKSLFPRRLREVSDPMSGFFAVRMESVDVEALRPLGFKILLEVLLRGHALRYAEVPFSFGTRQAGESKASAREGARFVAHMTRLRLAPLTTAGDTRARRGLLFGLVGASGIIVNLALTWLLADQRTLHINYVLAAALATQGSTTWNFLLNELLVFRGPKATNGWRRYVAFLALSNAVLPLRLPLLALLVSVLGFHYLVGNLLTLVLLFLIRFQASDRAIYRPPVNDATAMMRDGPVRIVVERQAPVARPARLPARAGTGYLPHRYDMAGLMTIASQVRLPELEFFHAPWLGRDLDLEIRVGEVGTGLRGRTTLTRFAEPAGARYEEHFGRLSANFEIEMTDRIDLVVSPLLARSNHVLYTNVIEALLRFMLVRRGFVLLHSACIELEGRGVMLSARTDTGKTGTILRLLREQDARFLSDDMTIVDNKGHAYCYPKPLTISQHTLRVIDPGDVDRLEWLKLRLRSRIHSKEGRGFAMELAERNLPIMTINAITQLLVPPPKYNVDRLVPCDVRGDVRVGELFVIERGSPSISEMSRDEALEELLTNTDDAYGFPPFRYFAPSIVLGGDGYLELRERERATLKNALHSVRVRRLVSDDFSWADSIPQLLLGRARPDLHVAGNGHAAPWLGNGRGVLSRPRVPIVSESLFPDSPA